ncbi:MAG: OmpA family protein, partial [Sphingopyxis sp.]
PPPPPPPPVCNSGPYIVFFDWDKDAITADAAQTLDNAVSAYANCRNTSVMIAGHADRSGRPTYNVGLSQRRANNVQGYMAARGIPGGAMSTSALGESQNRVPTPDGVRNDQNRRVEINYGPGAGR